MRRAESSRERLRTQAERGPVELGSNRCLCTPIFIVTQTCHMTVYSERKTTQAQLTRRYPYGL